MSDYSDPLKLNNPINDSEDINLKLESFGFDTIHCQNYCINDLDIKIQEFGEKLKDYDAGLFFFAGHGVQISGENYLLAIDVETSTEQTMKRKSLNLDEVITVMEKSGVPTKILILDACRTNPYARGKDKGLAPVYAPRGTIISFATSPGQVASDGKGRNGVFTKHLLQHIKTEELRIEEMFKRVRNGVAAETENKQITWEHTSLSGEFYFKIGIENISVDYNKKALADQKFVLISDELGHPEIEQLKSYNYTIQNSSIHKIDTPQFNVDNPDTLFVIGRNIYQSACGGSFAACGLINEIDDRIKSWGSERTEHVFNGILFEIFFNSSGALRNEIKGEYFNEVFKHEETKKLQNSFRFISNILNKFEDRYIEVPGRNKKVSVIITCQKIKNRMPDNSEQLFLEEYYIKVKDARANGKDITDKIQECFDKRNSFGRRKSLETIISEKICVPKRLLKFDLNKIK